MFFEQNLLEPNVGTARFWRLTGATPSGPRRSRATTRPVRPRSATLERGLAGKDFVVGGRYTVADCALYAYTRVAHEAGYDMAAYPADRGLARARRCDAGRDRRLEPYPAAAHAGAGGRSAHDAPPTTPGSG